MRYILYGVELNHSTENLLYGVSNPSPSPSRTRIYLILLSLCFIVVVVVVVGMLHNFGGRNGLYGTLPKVNQGPIDALNNPQANLVNMQLEFFIYLYTIYILLLLLLSISVYM